MIRIDRTGPDGRTVIEFEQEEYVEPPDVPCALCAEPVPYWMVPRELGPDFVFCSICSDIAPNTGRLHWQYWNVPNRILLSIGEKMVAHLAGKACGARVRKNEERMRQWRESMNKGRQKPSTTGASTATSSTASTSVRSSPS